MPSPGKRPVRAIDPLTRVVVAYYDSIADAERDGFSGNSIVDVLAGRQLTSGGFLWESNLAPAKHRDLLLTGYDPATRRPRITGSVRGVAKALDVSHKSLRTAAKNGAQRFGMAWTLEEVDQGPPLIADTDLLPTLPNNVKPLHCKEMVWPADTDTACNIGNVADPKIATVTDLSDEVATELLTATPQVMVPVAVAVMPTDALTTYVPGIEILASGKTEP